MLFTRCQATRDAVAQAARAPHGLAPALLAHVFPPTAHTCLAPRSCPCVPRAGDAIHGRPGEKRQGDSAEAMWQHAHWSRGAAHLRLQHTGFNAHTCRTAVAAAAAVLPYVPKAPRPSYSTLTRPCLRQRGSRPSGTRRLSPAPILLPFLSFASPSALLALSLVLCIMHLPFCHLSPLLPSPPSSSSSPLLSPSSFAGSDFAFCDPVKGIRVGCCLC